MGLSGLEPPTSRLSGARSNHLSYEPIFVAVLRLSLHPFGGDDGIRTHDPLLAGQVLSQLSYTHKGSTLRFPLESLFQWSFKIEQQTFVFRFLRTFPSLGSMSVPDKNSGRLKN